MPKLPYAKKELGQHWLEDKASLQSMITAAQVVQSDAVLEIGPGTGTLTDELLQAGAEVTALEFDRQRVNDLKRRYSSANVTIEEGDIRAYDFDTLPESYKIVANIPYYLTANLLRKLTEDKHKPQIAVLLVQKEVAQRVTASAGDLSQIAIFVQIYYDVELGPIVPAHLFTPPPKVDSQILKLTLRDTPLYVIDDVFKKLLKAGFGEKRKKLRTSLSNGLSISKQETEQLLEKASISAEARAQELTLTDWHKLAEELHIQKH